MSNSQKNVLSGMLIILFLMLLNITYLLSDNSFDDGTCILGLAFIVLCTWFVFVDD